MISYLDFWKLNRPPFDAGPDPAFFFESRAHGEALARLSYFTADRAMGLAAITGEIGAGKTLTLQVLASRLPPDAYRMITVFTAPETPAGILAEINRGLGGAEPRETVADADALRREFHRLLRQRIIAPGRHLLMVIDEAQLMNEACLDTVKCLTNPVESGEACVSIILSGQPELKARLRALPQVYQRMGLIYHLGYLTREEVPSYVRHRLTVAKAASADVFDTTALDLLYSFSNGCPRQINRICKLAVDRACMLHKSVVDAATVEMIISDFEKHFS
jgi:type II secretory pathway predicted ATPase ExeA